MKNIDIVMATYNGARYISQQLESIIAQRDFFRYIIIHDDGSSDNTPSILRMYQEHYSEVIRIIDLPSTGGAKNNFSLLLQESDAEYIFCADQDDIWLDGKLQVYIDMIKSMESELGSDLPILIHGDLKVIDDKNQAIAESFWNYQNLNPAWSSQFNLTLTQNVVTGCTLLVNRHLLNLALPIPKNAIMHDWWLTLVATAFGRVKYIKEPYVCYRQHDNNEIGAKNFSFKYILKVLRNYRHVARVSEKATISQANEFTARYGVSIHANAALEFAKLANLKQYSRIRSIFKYRFFKVGLIRNLGWIIKL